MIPDKYRKQLSKNSLNRRGIHSNNFYNGRLEMSELNTIPDNLRVEDIYQAQKNEATTYHLTLAKARFVSGINFDLQNSADSLAQAAYAPVALDTINSINKDMDAMLIQYSPMLTNLKNSEQTDGTQEKLLKSIATSAAIDYRNILNNIIAGATIRGSINSSSLIGQISSCEKRINELIATNPNAAALSSNFFAIMNSLRKAKGFEMEEEIVKIGEESLPHDFVVTNLGTLRVGGKIVQGGADIGIFDKNSAKSIQVKWTQRLTEDPKSRPQGRKGSLLEFLQEQEKLRKSYSFSVDESVYEKILTSTLLAAQAKAIGTNTKNIKMVENVQLFNSSKGTTKDGLAFDSINFNFNQYQSKYSRAVVKMAHLYNLSAIENKPRDSNYFVQAKQYAMLTNMALSKMLSWIMKHNDILITPRYGLISLADLFLQHPNTYFYWGTPSNQGVSMLNLNKLVGLKRNIYLRLGAGA